VGAAVANALSAELVVEVWRDGGRWKQRFVQGVPVGKLEKLGASRGSGSKIHLRPDGSMFSKVAFDPQVLRERLEAKSYLHRGLKIVFVDPKGPTREEFHPRGAPGVLHL
jgi:DNA gyrase/topoisomerase IV subunit B